MSDTTEPAIPVRALIPLQAHRDLLQFAEADLGGLSRTGVKIDYEVLKGWQAGTVRAIFTVKKGRDEFDAGVKVTYHGREVSYGGFVQWTRD